MRRAAIAAWCLTFLCLPANAAGHGSGASGTLVEVHGHRADGSEVARSFELASGGTARALDGAQPPSLIGQRVHVDDSSAQPGLQGTARAASEQRLAAAVAPGPRSLLVILVTTPDAPTPVATPEATRTAVFTSETSANAFYVQQSAGATRFVGRVRSDGDIAGPLAIGVSTTGCDARALAAAADARARAAGWAVDAYDHVHYALPSTSQCPWAGLGALPGRLTWSNGNLSTRVMAHELGHNLGAHHANSSRCTDAGAVVTLSRTCTSSEYGDPFDVMGHAARLMSSWHRAKIGELPSAQELRLRDSQTVTLVSSDDFAADGPRLLLVPRKSPGVAVSSWLAVELRSELGPFDLWRAGDPVTTGLSVRVVPAMTIAAQSQLLDARPDTSSFADAPLQAPDLFRDDAHAITIKLNAITGAAASVTVTMPALVDDVPPSTPRNLSFAGDTNAVVLRWAAAADDEAVAHYEVLRDGVLVGTTPGLSFEDTRVAALTETTYRVTAVDTSGNRGAPLSVRAVLADATAPGAVPGLAAAANGAEVTLTWSTAADNRAIRGYRISRDGVLRSEVRDLTFTELPPAGSHRYAVSAVDTTGNVGPSTEVLVDTKAPPPPAPPIGILSPDAADTTTGSALQVPGPTTPSAARRPRIERTRYRRRGREVTMTFVATGATSLSAYVGSRRVGRASGARLNVRIRVPRAVKRRKIRVLAASPAGSASRTYALR